MNGPILFDPWLSGRLCLTLLHSVWQVAWVAVLVDLIGRTWFRRSVAWQYSCHVGGLLLCMVAMPITFALVEIPAFDSRTAVVAGPQRVHDPASPGRAEGIRPVESLEPNVASDVARVQPGWGTPGNSAMVVPSLPWLSIAPWLVGLYTIGMLGMLLRLFIGTIRAEHLRRRARPMVEGPLVDAVRTQSSQWSMRFVPMVAQTAEIAVPRVIGLLKPTILLPASGLTGLTITELKLIVAHELAHVRRYDLWVNLLQRFSEVILFFNPAAWYVSRRISILREYCCDELACAARCGASDGPRLEYATALLKVAELAGIDTVRYADVAALAAHGRSPSQLRCRIARLCGEPCGDSLRLSRAGVGIVAVGVFLLLGSPAIWLARGQSQEQPEQVQQAFPEVDQANEPLERPGSTQSLRGWISDLSLHNQAVSDVGSEAINALPPDKAWQIVRQAWYEIQLDDIKTTILTTFHRNRHPRILEVLDLGALDPSPIVRAVAFSHLRNFAMRDFSDPQHDYRQWRQEFLRQSVDDVLRANCHWFVAQLREKEPIDEMRWSSEVGDMLNMRGKRTSYPQKAAYLRDAGFIELLTEWRDAPDQSERIKHRCDDLINYLRLGSLAVDESHQRAQLQGRSLAGAVHNRQVDELLLEADLSNSNLTDARLIGGMKAFFGTDFSQARLANAVLVGQAAFQRARFDRADLTKANMHGGGAGFQEASFVSARLTNAHLAGGVSSFQMASFENADLSGSHLHGEVASFQVANFDNAKLLRATIVCTGTTAFQGARLNNTDFSGAVLTTMNAGSLGSCQFDPATPPKYSDDTKFPKGFHPKRAGWKKLGTIRESGNLVLSGRINDEQGSPMADVTVILYSGFATRFRGQEATTDANGEYRFDPLKTGSLIMGSEHGVALRYTGVQFRHDDFVPADRQSWRDIVVPCFSTHHEVLNMTMTRGGRIRGTVVDGETGAPMPELALRIHNGDIEGDSHKTFWTYATTDADGQFTSDPVYPDHYVIQVNSNDFRGERYPAIGAVDVKAGEITDGQFTMNSI